jgi:hypothetical protein
MSHADTQPTVHAWEMGSIFGWRTYHPSDGVLQLLGGAKGDLLAGLDPDGLAGGWIASHTRCTVTNLQDAETG